MPSLLVSQYQPMSTQLLSTMANIGMEQQRMDAARDAQAQSMAANLLRTIQERQQQNERLAFAREQEARVQRQMELQQTQAKADDDRSNAWLKLNQDRFNADNKPYKSPFGEAASPSGSVAEGLLGKVTSYGYADDPHGDSASLGTGKWLRPTGAWNNALRPSSFAISPDIEKLFKAQGIKEGDSVALQLANGQIINRTWDDRTMQDDQAVKKFGKPLRGRFDFYSPDGEHKLDGAQVVGFRPSQALAQAMTTAAPANASPSIPATDAPTQQIRSMAAHLEAIGAPQGAAQKLLMGAIPRLVAPRSTGSTAGPRIRRFADGSDRQLNPQTGEWDVLETKPEKDTTAKDQQAAERDRRSEERLVLSKIENERAQLKPLEEKFKKLKAPEWPWEENGKYYRARSLSSIRGNEEISQSEYQKLMERGNATEWAKVNGEIENRRQKIAGLESGLNAPAAPSAPASAPVEQMVSAPAATDEKISVIAPNGKKGRIPKGQLEAALKAGYKQV